MARCIQVFGFVLITAILLWDADAMRIHIIAHSWLTLGYVSLYPISHVADYFTIGRITNSRSIWS